MEFFVYASHPLAASTIHVRKSASIEQFKSARVLFQLRYILNKTHGTDFFALTKSVLLELADGLLYEDSLATSLCVDFVCSETLGIWHGRARAMMCRRLKHISLDKHQSARLTEHITNRLASGRFSEQFKDQLRLAMALDSKTLFDVALQHRANRLPHVRAYTEWVLMHQVVYGRVRPETTDSFFQAAKAAMTELHIIFTEEQVILSKKTYGSWQDIQKEYAAFKASLGPWDKNMTISWLSAEYRNLAPSAEEQVELLLSNDENFQLINFRE